MRVCVCLFSSLVVRLLWLISVMACYSLSEDVLLCSSSSVFLSLPAIGCISAVLVPPRLSVTWEDF